MAALFKRGQRPGPIAPFKTWPTVSTGAAFKTWPKTDTLGRVLNVAISFTLGKKKNLNVEVLRPCV